LTRRVAEGGVKLTPELLAAKQAQFGRVASTQRIVLRGIVFIGAIVGLAAGVGSISRAISDVPGALYTGTAFVSPLEPIRQRLDSRRGDREIFSLQADRASEIARLAGQYS